MLPLSLWDNNCHDDDNFHHNEDDGNEGRMRDRWRRRTLTASSSQEFSEKLQQLVEATTVGLDHLEETGDHID